MLNIQDALKDFIVDEPNSNIGFLVHDEVLKKEIEKISQDRVSVSKDFAKLNLKRLPFIGEFFETIIIQDNKSILNPIVAKQLAKVIQKNRMMILITNIEVEKIQAIYEPFEFSDFSEFKINNLNIVLLKKWFKW